MFPFLSASFRLRGTVLIVGHLHTPETPGTDRDTQPSRSGVGHRCEHHCGTRRHQRDIVIADEPIRTLTDRACGC